MRAYVTLVILTILIYFLDRNLPFQHGSKKIIIFISMIKFSIIYYVFMNIKNAHLFWKVLGGLLIVSQLLIALLI